MVKEAYKNIGSPEDTTIEECAELIKECTELIKAVCKSKRFGWDNFNPLTNISNIDNVLSEIEDVVLRCTELKMMLNDMKATPHEGHADR